MIIIITFTYLLVFWVHRISIITPGLVLLSNIFIVVSFAATGIEVLDIAEAAAAAPSLPTAV